MKNLTFLFRIIILHFVVLFYLQSIYADQKPKKMTPGNHTDTIESSKPIVMFGNSITYQGNWEKALQRNDVTNWGIPGYTTGQLAWTIKNLVPLNPTIVFIEGGINDLSLGIPPKRIYENQVQVLQEFRSQQITPVLQSIILTEKDKTFNKKIKRINNKLRKYCLKENFDFIDLNALLSENGFLKEEYSRDGVHLKEAAYKPWGEAVIKMLEQKGI